MALRLGLTLLAILLLLGGVVLFAGPLLRPLAEARAAAALGRPVSIGRLHIRPGRVATITIDDVRIGNPPEFPPDAPPLARLPRATIELDLAALLFEQAVVLPRIAVDRPQIEALALPDRRANYLLDIAGPVGRAGEPGAEGPRIGQLSILEGEAHVAIAWLAADFRLRAATEDAPDGTPRIVAAAEGTYAGQPIAATLLGGAVLDLRRTEQPWPLRLELANGPTRVVLEGTVLDPLALRGADMWLEGSGPDMALLEPLSGVPFPPTPPFHLRGRLDYAAGQVRFLDAQGQVGRTDVSGGLIVTVAGRPRTVVAAEVRSRRVDLADLAGFFGAEPGRPQTPGMTAPQREAAARRQAAPRLLSDAPLDLPRMRRTDIHVDYSADRIEGRGIPFDSLMTQFDVVDGVVEVRRLVLPVGDGRLAARVTMTPEPDGATLAARGEIELQRLDFGRLMGAAQARGSGRLGGVARFEGRGRSLAEIAAGAEGRLTAMMVGGTVSALLVDLSGLRFGKALFSALGLPDRERVECLVADFPLRRGTLTAQTLVMETDSALITGGGRISLREERLDLRIRTESKRLTIGSLPAPVLIRGTLKDPSVGVESAEAAARAGVATGLGAILPPLAALPTIQLGVGESTVCERLQARARGGRQGDAAAGGPR